MVKMAALEEEELLCIIIMMMVVAVGAIPEGEAPIRAMVPEDPAVAIIQGPTN